MRRNILWYALAATLLTTAHAATIPDYPFVYVTGEAEVKVPPDVADATLSVLAEDPNAAVAEQTVESGVNGVLKLLRAAGVSDSRIDASGISKEVVTTDETENKPIVIRGYKVSRQFSVRITDLKKWPEIATRLLELQNVTDVEVTFGRSDAKRIDATLVGKAAMDAQERAQRLAKSFGQHAGAVMALSQSPFSNIGPTFGMGSEEGGDSAGAPVMEMVVTGRRGSSLLIPDSIELSVEVHALVKLQ